MRTLAEHRWEAERLTGLAMAAYDRGLDAATLPLGGGELLTLTRVGLGCTAAPLGAIRLCTYWMAYLEIDGFLRARFPGDS